MEIPPHLQERTNDLTLLLELESELGKDAANQFISIRSAIYYGDNGLPGIDPQVVMGPGSPNGDDSWKHAFTQDSDYRFLIRVQAVSSDLGRDPEVLYSDEDKALNQGLASAGPPLPCVIESNLRLTPEQRHHGLISPHDHSKPSNELSGLGHLSNDNETAIVVKHAYSRSGVAPTAVIFSLATVNLIGTRSVTRAA
ncbi:hypothetical protein B0J14DRAFT_331714 [Halenospora varia]|nr:hypothetical protein B0J14DRAFT_331714 [Halenospora varia]